MSPFNPTNAQFYYDTASRLERAVQSNSEQMLKYEAEIAALRTALHDAATSLCTISQQAGRTEDLREFSQIRGYAFSRYSDALAKENN